MSDVTVFQERRATYFQSLWLCAACTVAGITAAVLLHGTLGLAVGGALIGLAVIMFYGFAAIWLRCPACNAPQITLSVAGFTLGARRGRLSPQSSGASVSFNPHTCLYCDVKLR